MATPGPKRLAWTSTDGITLTAVQLESTATEVDGAVISSAIAIPGTPRGVISIPADEDVVVRFIADIECRVHADDEEDLLGDAPAVSEDDAAGEAVEEPAPVVRSTPPVAARAQIASAAPTPVTAPTFSRATLTALRVLGGLPSPVAGASKGLALPYRVAVTLAG
jgi:hypothetical protein